jgi:hypothetical protein
MYIEAEGHDVRTDNERTIDAMLAKVDEIKAMTHLSKNVRNAMITAIWKMVLTEQTKG